MFEKVIAISVANGFLLVTAIVSTPAMPQPDVAFWGTISVNGVTLTQDDTNYTITLKVDGMELVRYTMGDSPSYGDHYALVVPVDDDPAVANKGQAADTAHILVNNNPVDESPVTLGRYGTKERLDLHASITIRPDIGDADQPWNGEQAQAKDLWSH